MVRERGCGENGQCPMRSTEYIHKGVSTKGMNSHMNREVQRATVP